MAVDRSERSDDRGAGLLGTLAGFVVFLVLMFAAVQVLFDLYATSMVTSAAHDAARFVAGFDSADDRCAATALGDRIFEESLGAYADRSAARLSWTCAAPDSVRVQATADHPSLLPPILVGLTGLGHVDRTIVVRVERIQ